MVIQYDDKQIIKLPKAGMYQKRLEAVLKDFYIPYIEIDMSSYSGISMVSNIDGCGKVMEAQSLQVPEYESFFNISFGDLNNLANNVCAAFKTPPQSYLRDKKGNIFVVKNGELEECKIDVKKESEIERTF